MGHGVELLFPESGFSLGKGEPSGRALTGVPGIAGDAWAWRSPTSRPSPSCLALPWTPQSWEGAEGLAGAGGREQRWPLRRAVGWAWSCSVWVPRGLPQDGCPGCRPWFRALALLMPPPRMVLNVVLCSCQQGCVPVGGGKPVARRGPSVCSRAPSLDWPPGVRCLLRLWEVSLPRVCLLGEKWRAPWGTLRLGVRWLGCVDVFHGRSVMCDLPGRTCRPAACSSPSPGSGRLVSWRRAFGQHFSDCIVFNGLLLCQHSVLESTYFYTLFLMVLK